MNSIDISFVAENSRALIPTRSHDDDAGFDLCSVEAVRLAPGERASVGTGLSIALPAGTAGLVLPRSGNALRLGLSVVNAPGLIDSGYRGEVRVLLINHGAEVIDLEPGSRIAQLVVVDLPQVRFVQVDQLEGTTRGVGGFGSTGA
jgi:dUTP pyrophosphatase